MSRETLIAGTDTAWPMLAPCFVRAVATQCARKSDSVILVPKYANGFDQTILRQVSRKSITEKY